MGCLPGMNVSRRGSLLVAVALLCASLLPQNAAAETPRRGAVVVERAWTRATGPTAQTAVAYLAIENRSGVQDRLVSASSPAARVVEMHETTMDAGIMRMRPVAGGVPLPPNGTLLLEPDGGGTHLMLVGPTRAFARGERVPLTLTFEHAGDVTVEMTVEAAGARRSATDGGHGTHAPPPARR